MYYIEPVESESIELQEPYTESDVIKYARSFSNETESFFEALKVLQRNGYVVYSD